MFPGPYAQIYRNEAGEPLGWDNVYPEDYDPPDDDPFDWPDEDEEDEEDEDDE